MAVYIFNYIFELGYYKLIGKITSCSTCHNGLCRMYIYQLDWKKSESFSVEVELEIILQEESVCNVRAPPGVRNIVQQLMF